MHRYQVLVPDYLTDVELEKSLLGDIADITPLALSRDEEFVPHAHKADALLLYHDIGIGQAAIAKMDRCRGIVRCGVGFNNVDLAAAGERGILVCNVPDYGTEDVADHAIMMLLALPRKLVENHNVIVSGGWEPALIFGAPRMRGRTLGIIGCGRIGTAMALRAKPMGIDILYYDPFARPGTDKALGLTQTHSLDELLAKSDFVTLHCPLTAKTHHILNAKTLAKMKPTAYLVNTARGPCVDNEALVEALDQNHLAGAALDVTDPEPPVSVRLRTHPKILLTPHVAYYSDKGFLEMRTKGADEARRLLLGEPVRNLVNRAYLKEPRSALPELLAE